MALELPSQLLQQVLLSALEEEEGSTVASNGTSSPPSRDSSSWALVSREWARLVYAYRWANRAVDVSQKQNEADHEAEKVAGRRCPPFLVDCIAAIELRGLSNDWMVQKLVHFAPFLLSLRLAFVDRPTPEGLLALRQCINLERLDLTCEEDQPGSLHDIFDVLRFLPALQRLSIDGFAAPSPPPPLRHPPSKRKKRCPRKDLVYTFPSDLATLQLYNLRGRNLEKFLLRALDPAYFPSLGSLTLSGFSNSTSQAVISLLGSNLQYLVSQIDCRKSPPVSLLPQDQPFPFLTLIVLELVGTTTETFQQDCERFRYVDRDLVKLKEVFLVDPAMNWPADDIQAMLKTLQLCYPASDVDGYTDANGTTLDLVEGYKRFMANAIHDETTPAARRVITTGNLFLAWRLRISPSALCTCKGALKGVPPVPAKEIAEKNANWRRKKDRRDAKVPDGAVQQEEEAADKM
ncbi:hypothetical protein JCM11251_000289 [Rhodosporidiobolus azoricus]